ncbi:MAG: hypothetical protein MI806_03055 [Minwuiales bacterium]|nr:hypothetical protein [Minwuiales bacterium]
MRFFASLVAGLLLTAGTGAPMAAAEPAWIVSPDVAGENLPPVGRSVFDFLVADRRGGETVMNVPFPFEALTDRIAARLQENGGPALRQVLVPLGRSLQRFAADPDYFAFPRVVVAVEAEPADPSAPMVRDRLFLAYQEKSEVVEVISYNEAAGRFEFQVVRDYRPGGKPQVLYAERRICVACHQSHAPIFATALWDETNANPQIAALLGARASHFYGVPVDQGVDFPDAIDEATGRANRFAAVQAVWRQGCGIDASADCRADAFLAALQFRLGGYRHATPGVSEFRDRYAHTLAAEWRKVWPDGFWLSNPDIPNRALPVTDDLTPEQMTQLIEADGPLAPTEPRQPLARWHITAPDDPLIDRLVEDLAGFLAASDISRLDSHLAALDDASALPHQAYTADCGVRPVASGGGQREIRFDCAAYREGLAVRGYAVLHNGDVVGGAVERIGFGERAVLTNLAIGAGNLQSRDGHAALALSLFDRATGLRARLSDGNALGPIRIVWRPDGQAAMPATAEASIIRDFDLVATAVRAMARGTEANESDALSAKPFRRASLMPALFEQLGIAPADWCCLADAHLPAAREDLE